MYNPLPLVTSKPPCRISTRDPGDHRHGGGAGGVREELQAYRFLEDFCRISMVYGTYIWKIYGRLVGDLEHLDYFSIIYGIIIPTGFHIFQKG